MSSIEAPIATPMAMIPPVEVPATRSKCSTMRRPVAPVSQAPTPRTRQYAAVEAYGDAESCWFHVFSYSIRLGVIAGTLEILACLTDSSTGAPLSPLKVSR